jgi:hypothetical protein
MKRIIFILATFLIITSGYAQVSEKSERKFYKQGDWEFGFSLNIGGSSEQTKQTSTYSDGSSQYSYTYDYTEKGFYTHLGVSIGYYIINGLSIEPEFDLNLYNWEISVSLLSNLCYTFYLPQKNIYPYLKLGYGLSTEPGSSNLFEFLDINTINAGVGIKLNYSSGMAFRMEINYRNLIGSNIGYYSNYDTITSVISISFGASILL